MADVKLQDASSAFHRLRSGSRLVKEGLGREQGVIGDRHGGGGAGCRIRSAHPPRSPDLGQFVRYSVQ